MFVAFDGPPRILRLYGTGVVHELGSPEYEQYLPEGQRSPGSRAVIAVDVSLVSTVGIFVVLIFIILNLSLFSPLPSSCFMFTYEYND
jgi:hypothetical protein